MVKMAFHVPVELKHACDRVAAEAGETLAAFIRRAMERELQRASEAP